MNVYECNGTTECNFGGQPDIPTSHFSSPNGFFFFFLFRKVVAPKILIPKYNCSERFLIRNVFYSERFLFRTVFDSNGFNSVRSFRHLML